jgi:hypothetical protein
MRSSRLGVALLGLLSLAWPACRSSTADAPLPSVPCDSTALAQAMDEFAPADVAVHVDLGDDPGASLVQSDYLSYLHVLWGPGVTVSSGAPDFSKKLTIWVSTSDAARAKAGVPIDRGYAIQRVAGTTDGSAVIVVAAKSIGDATAGAYALLEELGIRFFHPKQEYVPKLAGPRVPKTLAIARAPAAESRGIQPHTLHPIEYFQVLNQPGDDNLADAKRLVDWLVKTGQNHLQWPLLSTVPFDAWKPHAQAIVAYARSRGVTVGAVLQMWGGSSLQNNYVLVSNAANWQSQMDAALDRAMQIDWDVVELALGEFVSSDPQTIIDWLNHAVDHLLTTKPTLQVSVQNHVGNYPKLWVQYQGKTVFFYHLPQFADARLGQTVHTLFFFDLYRDWATYKHPDFHLQHEYLLQEIPTRRVKYFPESAYWISADVDVPLFLPEFVHARWNDIHTLVPELASKGLPPLAGHVTFTSGHEWLYWLTDYLTAKMLWQPDASLDAILGHYGDAFGSCGADVTTALSSLVTIQSTYLFDQKLIPYLQGENTTVDFGYGAGYETHPQRVAYEKVYAMSEPDRASFESTVVAKLEAMAKEMQPLEDAIAARCRGADDTIRPWCDELWDGISITRLRAVHAAHLYRAVLAKARGGDAESEYAAATTTSAQAATVVAHREPGYRFDAHRLVDAYSNPTVYGFGYLRTAHTLCFWSRNEQQVRYLLDDDGAGENFLELPSCQE